MAIVDEAVLHPPARFKVKIKSEKIKNQTQYHNAYQVQSDLKLSHVKHLRRDKFLSLIARALGCSEGSEPSGLSNSSVSEVRSTKAFVEITR